MTDSFPPTNDIAPTGNSYGYHDDLAAALRPTSDDGQNEPETILDLIEELNVEVERLKAKCDMQAMILRRLTPENHPDTLFIHGLLGEKNDNGMPEQLLVVPAYGCDFSYIYQRTDKTTGPEW